MDGEKFQEPLMYLMKFSPPLTLTEDIVTGAVGWWSRLHRIFSISVSSVPSPTGFPPHHLPSREIPAEFPRKGKGKGMYT